MRTVTSNEAALLDSLTDAEHDRLYIRPADDTYWVDVGADDTAGPFTVTQAVALLRAA
jgi:hypothetical protein